MSIYLKLNEINNELIDKEGRIRQLENGIITAATASNYKITNLLTASYVTASNFSASSGLANLTRLTASNARIDNLSIVNGINTYDLDVFNRVTTDNLTVNNSLTVGPLSYDAMTDDFNLINAAILFQDGANIYGESDTYISVGAVTASNFLVNSSLICSGNIRMRSPYGIDFSATSNTVYGTVTSEIFSDYEEGTWTPEISGSTTAGTITYGAGNQGRYTKIGRNIFIQGTVAVSGISVAPVGNINISGLPFTNINLSAPFFISYITGFNTNFNLVNGTVAINGRSVQLYKTLNATTNSSTAVTGSDITSTLTLIFSGFLTQ
jgi:hypothetical protein